MAYSFKFGLENFKIHSKIIYLYMNFQSTKQELMYRFYWEVSQNALFFNSFFANRIMTADLHSHEWNWFKAVLQRPPCCAFTKESWQVINIMIAPTDVCYEVWWWNRNTSLHLKYPNLTVQTDYSVEPNKSNTKCYLHKVDTQISICIFHEYSVLFDIYLISPLIN